MQGKSLTDFLQVSINTDKFNHFATTLTNALAAHDKQLQQHTKELAQVRLAMEDRFSRITCELEFEKQRFDKKRREDSDFFESFINDIRRKHDDLAGEAKIRMNAMEEWLKKQQERSGEGFFCSLKEELKANIVEQVNGLEQEIISIQSKVKEIESEFKKNISTQDFILKNVLDAYEGKPRGEREASPSNFKPHTKRPTRRESYFAKEDREKNYPLEQATIREGKERRRRRAQEKCQQENLQYASISAKIDSLETRLTAKENESLNKVVYANLKSHNLGSEASQQAIPMSMDRIEFERKNLQQNITSKLQHIQEIIEEKFAKSEKETVRLKNKYDVLQDQCEIMDRKFDKERTKIADLAFQLKKFQQKKLDDKLIENLVLMVKRQTSSLEGQVDTKLNKDIWEHDKTRVHEKLQILTQSLDHKADKHQIKRAFQFIEDKIKEIVLLMADDAQQEKEGAGRKLPFKCLSCDKDLDSSNPNTYRQTTALGPSRCSSSNLRRRIRAGPCESR